MRCNNTASRCLERGFFSAEVLLGQHLWRVGSCERVAEAAEERADLLALEGSRGPSAEDTAEPSESLCAHFPTELGGTRLCCSSEVEVSMGLVFFVLVVFFSLLIYMYIYILIS